MSQVTVSESIQPDNAVKPTGKCKIPQRCLQSRTRYYNKPKKCASPHESVKSKVDPSGHLTKTTNRNVSRSISVERNVYPSSRSNRERTETTRMTLYAPKTDHERNMPKKVLPFTKKLELLQNQREPFVVVPLSKNVKNKAEPHEVKVHYRPISFDSITTELVEGSVSSETEAMIKLQQSWEEKMKQFDKMKDDLQQRQRSILDLYHNLKITHEMMYLHGLEVDMPVAEELNVMNLAKLSPEQLLFLCTHSNMEENSHLESFSIDMNRLYNIPTNLVETCEKSLVKHKEIITWLNSLLQSKSKGIRMNNLISKINDFSAENDMLSNVLNSAKEEFLEEIKQITTVLRKGFNETMAMQMRTEEITREISKLNLQNAELRKRLQKAESLKTFHNKAKIEELEKELKDEKCARAIIRDHYTRSENQVKASAERTAQLEASLEQSRGQNWSHERTIQGLREENEALKNKLDERLNKLNASIDENTQHLTEINATKDLLQKEKEELEKRLQELSQYYSESLANMKDEVNSSVAKCTETEKAYYTLLKEKTEMENKAESLCAQLLNAELRNKDLLKEFKTKEESLDESSQKLKHLEETERNLKDAEEEINCYKMSLQEQIISVKQNENKLIEVLSSVEILKDDLHVKQRYIADLESKHKLLEQQLSDSDQKMECYEEQMTLLKDKLTELQKDFGELANVNDLRETIKELEEKLAEVTQKSLEASELMHSQLDQKDMSLNLMLEKEKEQANIIKLLQHNFEIISNVDIKYKDKLAEIDNLENSLDISKQQIQQLEKIILTLEDKSEISNQIRVKDQQKINMLEMQIIRYQSALKKSKKGNTDDLNIIEILSELNLKPHFTSLKEKTSNKSDEGEIEEDNNDRFDCNKMKTSSNLKTEYESTPAKIAPGTGQKRTCIHNTNELTRAIPNTNIRKKMSHANGAHDHIQTSSKLKKTLTREGSIPYLGISNSRDDKKYKMLKLAGHQL